MRYLPGRSPLSCALACAAVALSCSKPAEPPPPPPASTLAATPKPTPVPSPSPTPVPDVLDAITREEQMRLLQIVQNVYWYGSNPTAINHREFWIILRKLGPLTPLQMTQLRSRLTDPFTKGLRLFWEDALVSLANGSPMRSEERRRLEDALVELGFLSLDDVNLRTQRMEAIARRQPIALPGLTVVVDDMAVARVISAFDRQKPLLDLLFQPEQNADAPEEAAIRERSQNDAECSRLAREFHADEQKIAAQLRARDRSTTSEERGAIEKDVEKMAEQQRKRAEKWEARVDAIRTEVYKQQTAGKPPS